MADVNYEGFGFGLGSRAMGGNLLGGNLQGRIVINKRVQNVMNAIKAIQEYGPMSPAAYANLATGFAENNQMLLRGDAAKMKNLEYPYPVR